MRVRFRWAVTGMPLVTLAGWLVGSGCDSSGSAYGGIDGPSDASAADVPDDVSMEGSAAAPVITGLQVATNPHNVLSAIVTFTTDVLAFDQAQIVNVGDAGAANSFATKQSTAMSTIHTVNVVGLRASSSFDIKVTATDSSRRTSTATVSFSTPALPQFVPSMDVVLGGGSRVSPGYTMMALWMWDTMGSATQYASVDVPNSPLVIVDADAQVVWYYFLPPDPSYGFITDPRLLPNGHIAFITDGFGLIEIDIMGNVVQSVTRESMGLDTLHHDLDPMDGGYLSLSTQLKQIGGYPGLRDGSTWPVVGDVIAQFTPDGAVTATWSTFDMLPVLYEGNENMFNSGYWDGVYRGVGGTKDWTHGNAVGLDPTDPGSIVASSRTLGWIYKFRGDAGHPQRVWRLGASGDFTLTNTGDGWQYGQHAAHVLSNGHVMCFDDGNQRPSADGGLLGVADAFSRAVEFSLDTTNPQNMQATIVWQYGETNPTLFSSALGSAYVMDYPGGNGNVLVDDGGETTIRTSPFQDPTNFKFARVIEATHDMPPAKVAEFDVNVPEGSYPQIAGYSGYSVYRARRVPSLYP